MIGGISSVTLVTKLCPNPSARARRLCPPRWQGQDIFSFSAHPSPTFSWDHPMEKTPKPARRMQGWAQGWAPSQGVTNSRLALLRFFCRGSNQLCFQAAVRKKKKVRNILVGLFFFFFLTPLDKLKDPK